MFSRKQSVHGHVKAGKAFTQKVAFERLTTEHVDPQQCQSALVTTKSKSSLKQTIASSTSPKRNQMCFSNQHAGLIYQTKTKTKLGSLQSASWLSSRRKILTHTQSSPHQSTPLNLPPVHSTPIHTISPENTPFHSTPLHPRPVTCADPHCPPIRNSKGSAEWRKPLDPAASPRP